MEALINLKHNSSFKDYKNKFKLISNKVGGLSESYRLRSILERLKKKIKIGVHMLNPQT
jgi:hypothetical protein